jgi:hypothetical protein
MKESQIMSLAFISCSWYSAPGAHVAQLRAVGLVAMAIGIYFAFFTPRWLADRRRARLAQLSVALYTILTATAAGAVVLISHVASPTWFSLAGVDTLAGSGGVMLIATGLLVGAMLAIPSARSFRAGSVNMGALLAFPFLAAVGMDAFMLCYYWLDPSRPTAASACSAGPVGNGEIAIAAFSAVVALIAIVGAVGPLLSRDSLRAVVARAFVPAVAGAIVEMTLVVLRGPQHWATNSHLAGVDLMLACAVIGVWVFIAGMRTARNHFAPQPVRIDNGWFNR